MSSRGRDAAEIEKSANLRIGLTYEFPEHDGKSNRAVLLEQRFVALVDLGPGDELTRAWVDPMSPTWLRQHRLRITFGRVLKPTQRRPASRPGPAPADRAPSGRTS